MQIWADDGCPLYLDGRKLIDSWKPCSADSVGSRRQVTLWMTPGVHRLKVEYFQEQSLSSADTDPIKFYRRLPGKPTFSIVPDSVFERTTADLVPPPGCLD